jgi:hypothetical protein
MQKQYRSLVVFKLAQSFFIENDLTKKQFINYGIKKRSQKWNLFSLNKEVILI